MDESIWILAGINVLLAWSFYVIVMTGQSSFGNAGFMAVGAYVASIITVKLHAPYVAGLAGALVAGALLGCLVGLTALRLRGVYLSLATIGFGFLVQNFFANLEYVGAQVGMYGMQGTTLPIVIACVVVVGLLLIRLRQSRLGIAMQAVRDNEVVADTLGLNTRYLKLISFTTGAMLAALAGALYAHYLLFISPELFGFFQSIWPAFYVALGGGQTIIGPVLGATMVTLLPEWFQPLKEWRQITFGIAILVLLNVRPEGLITTRTLSTLTRGIRRLLRMPSGGGVLLPSTPQAPPDARLVPRSSSTEKAN